MSKKRLVQDDRTKKRMKIVMLGSIVFIFMGLLIYMVSNQQNPSILSVDANIETAIKDQPILGQKNAEVTIIEFGDYKCPGCKAWSQYLFPEVKKRWIDTGKAKLVFIHANLHGDESAFGAAASEAIYKLNPTAFWNFNKALFDLQPESDHDSVWITDEALSLAAIKSDSNLDLNTWNEFRKSDEIKQQVELDNQLMKQFNVQKTPTVIIDGAVLEDPFDLQKMEALINGKQEVE